MRRAALLAMLLAGCDGSAAEPGAPTEAPAGAAPVAAAPAAFPRANVLIITIDTVRADRLGCYGYSRPTSPHLDALAARSVLFEQAFANSSFTPPTHGSILTGLYPAEHGLRHWNKSLANVSTAADAFAAAGYFTLAVTPLPTLLILGLDRGFEQTESPDYSKRLDGSTELAGADKINEAALAWLLRTADKRPYFAWVHYYDAHRPYGRQGPEWSGRFADPDVPAVGANEGWYQLTLDKRERLHVDAERVQLIEDHYDGGLAFLDDRLGTFLGRLQEAGRLDDTIVVVVADHGEVFDEHEPEWFAHDPYLYDENVHIPLLVRLPGDAHAGSHVRDLVSQVDILPTLLELTGVLPLAGQRCSGGSLVPALAGRPLQRAVVFADREGDDLSIRKDGAPEPTDAQVRASRDRLQMLRTSTRKLLVGQDDGRVRLMDVTTRPGEQQDIKEQDHAAAAGAVQAYKAWVDSLRQPDGSTYKLDDKAAEFLKSLGYTGQDK